MAAAATSWPSQMGVAMMKRGRRFATWDSAGEGALLTVATDFPLLLC